MYKKLVFQASVRNYFFGKLFFKLYNGKAGKAS